MAITTETHTDDLYTDYISGPARLGTGPSRPDLILAGADIPGPITLQLLIDLRAALDELIQDERIRAALDWGIGGTSSKPYSGRHVRVRALDTGHDSFAIWLSVHVVALISQAGAYDRAGKTALMLDVCRFIEWAFDTAHDGSAPAPDAPLAIARGLGYQQALADMRASLDAQRPGGSGRALGTGPIDTVTLRPVE